MNPTIQPALAELERAYASLSPLFGEWPPENSPMIVVQSLGRRRALGQLSPQAWREPNSTREPINEITLASEYLAHPAHKIAETLLHEMVHHYNQLQGIRDCSASQYHNKQFRSRAESIGLIVERAGHRGFATTSLGPELRATVDNLGLNSEAFAISRVFKARKPQTCKMHKYACGCTIVRCATDLSATCESCGESFTAS